MPGVSFFLRNLRSMSDLGFNALGACPTSPFDVRDREVLRRVKCAEWRSSHLLRRHYMQSALVVDAEMLFLV